MKKSLDILVTYLTCEDPVIKNKWRDILDSFYHKDGGHLVKEHTVLENGDISITLSNDETITIEKYMLPNTMPLTFIEGLVAALNSKVDKVTGKQLSDENFTLLLKQKLDALQNYVHPDTHSINEVQGLQGALDGKVDKVAGKQLTDENFTTQEKTKLNGLENYNPPASQPKSYIQGLADDLTQINQDISSKVDKVDGKELSSNDYTDADKEKLNNTDGCIKKSIEDNYPTMSSLYDGELSQRVKLIYFVADASSHPLVDKGYAYFEYLGTTNGDETDYKLISKEIVISNLEYKLLFKTSSTSTSFKIHLINPLSIMKWFIIDNSNGEIIVEGSGAIEANLSNSSGNSSVYIEVDEEGLGITSFVTYYGDGKITFFDFNVVPKLEVLIIYTTIASQTINFQGAPQNLKHILLFGGAIQGLNLSQAVSLEVVNFYGSVSFDASVDISNSPALKTYTSTVYFSSFNVSNHRLLESLTLADTVSVSLDSNINTTYLPNLRILKLWSSNYYSLDLTTRDFSKLTTLDIKLTSVIGFNTMVDLLALKIKCTSTDLVFTGMKIESLTIDELSNTILDLKPLNNLRTFYLRYPGHSNLTDILIDNGNNALLAKFSRLYVSQGYSGGGDGIVNVKVDNPIDANNEVTPYLPSVWEKQYSGYDVLNFI